VRDAFAADFALFGYGEDPANLEPDPGAAMPPGEHAGMAERFADLWLAAQEEDPVAYRAALADFRRAENGAGRVFALPDDFDDVHAAAVEPPLVVPRLPDVLCRPPAALAAAAAPATPAQVAEVEEVRRAFRLPESGAGYSVDYARAFRIARGAGCYVEVGSRDKGTLAWVSGLLAEDATIVDIDLAHRPDATERLAARLRPEQRLVQIEGNSVEEKTLFRLRRAIGHGAADLVFLDSSHMYEHTRDEVAKYWHFLKPGGVMLVHDVFWEGNAEGKGKAQFFAMLDGTLPVYQIYMNEPLCRFHPNPRTRETWGGFGIIVKPEGRPEAGAARVAAAPAA
jgi:predicted O-methyltransferase YrrM